MVSLPTLFSSSQYNVSTFRIIWSNVSFPATTFIQYTLEKQKQNIIVRYFQALLSSSQNIHKTQLYDYFEAHGSGIFCANGKIILNSNQAMSLKITDIYVGIFQTLSFYLEQIKLYIFTQIQTSRWQEKTDLFGTYLSWYVSIYEDTKYLHHLHYWIHYYTSWRWKLFDYI